MSEVCSCFSDFCRKFAVSTVYKKIATSAPATFLTHDATDWISSTC